MAEATPDPTARRRSRSCRIEGKNAIAVEMQDRIEPRRRIGALARPLSESFHKRTFPDVAEAIVRRPSGKPQFSAKD